MTSASAGIKHNNVLRQIMLHCTKVGFGETSERALDLFNKTIEEGK